MELGRNLVYCASCGSLMVLREAERGGKVYQRYCCMNNCDVVQSICTDELDLAIVEYLRSLTTGDVREKLFAGYKRGVDVTDSRRKRLLSNRKAELSRFSRAKDLPLDIREKLKWCVQRLERLEADIETNTNDRIRTIIDDYFDMPVPESFDADPEGMRRAARWYLRRVIVHAANIEFELTLSDWQKRYAGELGEWWPPSPEAKPVSADGFEGNT